MVQPRSCCGKQLLFTCKLLGSANSHSGPAFTRHTTRRKIAGTQRAHKKVYPEDGTSLRTRCPSLRGTCVKSGWSIAVVRAPMTRSQKPSGGTTRWKRGHLPSSTAGLLSKMSQNGGNWRMRRQGQRPARINLMLTMSPQAMKQHLGLRRDQWVGTPPKSRGSARLLRQQAKAKSTCPRCRICACSALFFGVKQMGR